MNDGSCFAVFMEILQLSYLVQGVYKVRHLHRSVGSIVDVYWIFGQQFLIGRLIACMASNLPGITSCSSRPLNFLEHLFPM